MNTIFKFTNRNEFYKKCIYASIAHAVMVGRYDLLTDEISWDGNNYLFQNMEGTRGVFSFSDEGVVCALQNEEQYIEGVSKIYEKMLDSTDKKLLKITEEEIIPYFLVDDDNSIPGLTSLFWSFNDSFLSLMSEEIIMKSSSNILLPYLYEFDDLKKYWRDYYEADGEQMNLINSIFEKRMISNSFSIEADIVNKLKDWFGENHALCRQALAEIGIYY